MNDTMSCCWNPLTVAVLLVAGVLTPCAGEVSKNLLVNGSFDAGVDKKGIPIGWSRYRGTGKDQQIKWVDMGGDGGKALLLADGDRTEEIGLEQAVPAKGGLTYEASVEVRGVEGASSRGAYVQLRFLPSNPFAQTGLTARDTKTFQRVSAKGTAPAGTTHARVYLYTHRAPTPKVMLRNAKLVSGVTPPPPPPPAPVPPVYTKLKDLHLNTVLVRGCKGGVTIIAPASGVYQAQAERVQQAIGMLTGIMVPIADDGAAAAAVPIRGNLIAIGNRSTNKTISALYDRYYTLLDLRYPGPEGYVVRTLHNPFGDGRNVVFVGASDAVGVKAAADVLVNVFNRSGAKSGELTIGRVAEIRLGKGIKVPTDLREFETWEASKGYGSVGYFGWNSLSKRMAMYYMTGEPFHAREFIRLAFPDDKAKQDIAEIDGERIENKDAPLGGPYHYNAHMMILFWDLIEESPVFTDDERLRVTNAFAEQLNHRKGEGIYGLTGPPACVGSRHGQWSAVSIYCLGRYFQKDYPNRIWAQCVKGGQLHFRPLHEHGWVSGENDNLFWYNTAIAPIFTYLTLTGDRRPIENGVMKTLLRGQEMLASGRRPDWALNSASMGFLHKAAYLMQDGRWVHYRQRTGVDVNVFRLGQSYWPEPHLKPTPPDDLVGQWSINVLPEPMWWARNNGFKHAESVLFGSFRSASDASGDFILIDGFNGASRNPYHTFAILELRLGGHTLLKGYRNQLLIRADGLVEKRIAMDAALKYHEVVGSTAVAVGEVPDAGYCNWRRTLAQRVGRYALVVDDLTFRTDGDNIQVEILWETEHEPKTFADGHIEFTAPIEVPESRTEPGGQIWCCDLMKARRSGRVVTMEWVGPVKKDRNRTFFSLVGMQPGGKRASMGCVRLAENAAALALPSPALAVVGEFQGLRAELAVLAEDHLFGRGVTRIAVPSDGPQSAPAGSALVSATKPVDVDWDFESGALHVLAEDAAQIRVAITAGEGLRLDGKEASATRQKDGLTVVDLSPGRHVIGGARPDATCLAKVRSRLADLLDRGRKQRARAMAAVGATPKPKLPSLTVAMAADVGGEVVDLITVPAGGGGGPAGGLIYAAAGKTVHVFTPDGKTVRTLNTDGTIRMLRWWAEHGLLLVGCADEQVIAFDTSGKRKWTFTSVMHPDVFRAAKTYWFKSYPGHEGIHGLHTGVFLDGKSQAFVGSACTLEILDEHGKLIKRMPQFWGKVSHFAIIDGPKGSLNLLAARKYNGTNQVRVINNKKLTPGWRGFHTVPSGSTYVGGWSSMNRYHLFYEDVDGDGTKEVISEINGTWNRVTVWRADGRALSDASFGPGERIMAKNMRDLDVADLDGDGKKEIIAATSSGLIVALDCRCQKVWATRLEGAPTAMKCVTPAGATTPWVIVGCEDGGVSVLDGQGKPIRSDKVNGRPTCIETLDTAAGPMTLLATDKGEVKGFTLGQ